MLYGLFALSSFQVQSSDYKSAVWQIEGERVQGTGFFIDRTHFVTTFHFLESVFMSQNKTKKLFPNFLIKRGLKDINIVLSQPGNPNFLKIKQIVGLSYAYDLAILEIKGKTSHYLDLIDSQPKNLEPFTLLAYAKLGSANRLWTEHKIRALFIDKIFSYSIKSPYFENLSGMSGAPLINDKGQVVAVFTSSDVDTRLGAKTGITNMRAVKTHYLKTMIEDVRKRTQSLNIFSEAVDSAFLKEKKHVYDLALKGNPLYQYILADKLSIRDEQSFLLSLMENGKNFTDNSFEARLYWLEKAALNGLAPAQFELAFDLYLVKTGRLDSSKSVYWIKKSAEQAYAPAQHAVALFYKIGPDKNLNQRFHWMEKSAKQAYTPAQYELALMYKEAEGVEKDLSKSFYWMKEAAERAYAPAQYELALMYKEAEGVEHSLELSFYWMKKSAEQNHQGAQQELAFIYKKGEGVKQDFLLAIYWFKKIAKTGSYLALYELVDIYSQGATKDLELASQLFAQAEEEKNATPMERAKGLLNFEEHEKDKTKIFETVLNLAKTSVHVVSLYKLAQMYAKGEGTQLQPQLAFKWMKKAAERSYTPAQYELAQMYEKGKGTKRQPQLAVHWLEKASLGRHPLALEKLSCHNIFSPKSL